MKAAEKAVAPPASGDLDISTSGHPPAPGLPVGPSLPKDGQAAENGEVSSPRAAQLSQPGESAPAPAVQHGADGAAAADAPANHTSLPAQPDGDTGRAAPKGAEPGAPQDAPEVEACPAADAQVTDGEDASRPASAAASKKRRADAIAEPVQGPSEQATAAELAVSAPAEHTGRKKRRATAAPGSADGHTGIAAGADGDAAAAAGEAPSAAAKPEAAEQATRKRKAGSLNSQPGKKASITPDSQASKPHTKRALRSSQASEDGAAPAVEGDAATEAAPSAAVSGVPPARGRSKAKAAAHVAAPEEQQVDVTPAPSPGHSSQAKASISRRLRSAPEHAAAATPKRGPQPQAVVSTSRRALRSQGSLPKAGMPGLAGQVPGSAEVQALLNGSMSARRRTRTNDDSPPGSLAGADELPCLRGAAAAAQLANSDGAINAEVGLRSSLLGIYLCKPYPCPSVQHPLLQTCKQTCQKEVFMRMNGDRSATVAPFECDCCTAGRGEGSCWEGCRCRRRGSAWSGQPKQSAASSDSQSQACRRSRFRSCGRRACEGGSLGLSRHQYQEASSSG